MRKIILTEPARYFWSKGKGLFQAGFLDKESSFHIGEPETMVFDHYDQPAVPFTINGEKFYLLVKELNPEQQKELGGEPTPKKPSPSVKFYGESPNPNTRH